MSQCCDGSFGPVLGHFWASFGPLLDSFAQLGFEVWSLEFANCNLDKALFTSRARATRLIAPRAVFGRPVIGPSRATLCASVRRICWPARVWRQLARVLADSAAALSKLGPTMRLGLGLGMKIKFRIKIHTNRFGPLYGLRRSVLSKCLLWRRQQLNLAAAGTSCSLSSVALR